MHSQNYIKIIISVIKCDCSNGQIVEKTQLEYVSQTSEVRCKKVTYLNRFKRGCSH